MRDRYWDDPTLDPVERERNLRARQGAAVAQEEKRSPDEWTPPRRVAALVFIVFVGIYLLIWAGSVGGSGGPEGYVRTTEFTSRLTGVDILRSDPTRLYDLEFQRSTQSDMLSPFGPLPPFTAYDRPPFEAMLLSPLHDLPIWFSFAVWTMLTGLAIGIAVGLMDSIVPVPRSVGWVLSLAACSYLPVIRGLMTGQSGPFALLGLCGAYAAVKRGYTGWAVASLAVMLVKPELLVPVLLVLVLQNQRRVLAYFAALVILLWVVSVPFVGFGWPLSYIGSLSGSAGTAPGNAIYSLPGALSHLFGAPGAVITAILSVLLLVVFVVLIGWAWIALPDNEPHPGADLYTPGSDLLWALAAVAAVLLSFHPAPDDAAILVFPAWIVGAYAILGVWDRGISRVWLVLLSVGYFLAPILAYTGRGTDQNPWPNVVLLLFSVALILFQAVRSIRHYALVGS